MDCIALFGEILSAVKLVVDIGIRYGEIVGAVSNIVAVKLLGNISMALRESGGEASEYQDTTLFLGSLGATLERLRRTYIEDHAASQGGLESMKLEVSVVLEAVKSFKAKIDGNFAVELGANRGGGWKCILSAPRKVEYVLFVSKEAKSLQEKIAVPLSLIQMSLGIQTFGAVSGLIIETRRTRIQTRRVVSDLINHGTETGGSAASGLIIATRRIGIEGRSNGIKRRSVVSDLIDHGTETVRTMVSKDMTKVPKIESVKSPKKKELQKDTSLFLGGLGATLEGLRTYIDDHAASQGSLESVKVEVRVVLEAVKSFKAKIDGKFAAALGANRGGWKRIFSGPRKVEYALFVSKAAKSLQEKIAVPLSSIQMSLGIQTFGAVSDVESRVIEIQSNLVTASDDESRMKELLQTVGAWLNPVPSADDFEAFLRRLHPRTCEWVFDKPDFGRWMENGTDAIGPPLFWISGIPGAGKSCLATRIIQELREVYPLAYFYCDSKNEQKRSVLNILRTWAWQLLNESPGCLDKIVAICFKGAPPSIASMTKALKILGQRESGCRVVYVLDGLDECDPNARSELLSILPEILSHSRVLIVSRHLPDISSGISRCGRNEGFASLEISEADNGNDIKDYIQHAVADMDLGDEALVQTILRTLQENAKGIFLWTRLMIEYLSVPGRSIEEFERALMDLPHGLDELYGRVLDNLHSNSVTRERSQQLFQWLACALRPLKVGELKVALAIVLDEEHFQTKKLVPKFEDCLRQCCGPLVDIDAADRTVSLIHSSVKDFLLRTPNGKPTYSSLLVESGIAHVYIARACLTYLCFNEIGVVDVNEDLELCIKRLDAHFGTWEFLNYATLNWYKHLSVVRSSIAWTHSPPDKSIHSFRRLYSSQYNTVKWLQLVQSLGRGSREEESISPFEAVQFFESFDSARLEPEHKTMFELWLEHLHGRRTRLFSRLDRFINASPFHYSPVWHISAYFDFDTLTKELMREGGFLCLHDHVGNTPLHEAAGADEVDEVARGDEVEVTKLFLTVAERAVVADEVDEVAYEGGQYARTESAEVDEAPPGLVHLCDDEGNTGGDEVDEVAREDKGQEDEVDEAPPGLVHICDDEGNTRADEAEEVKGEDETQVDEVDEAAREDEVEVFKLLLVLGDTGLVDHLILRFSASSHTPLHQAAREDGVEVAESLFAVGASIDAQNLEGASLELARRYGLLMVASTSINSAKLHEYERLDRDIDTPLTDRKGCLAIPVLIAGANVHARARLSDNSAKLLALQDLGYYNYAHTSLHNTARVNNYDAVRMLLEHGADANSVAGCDGSLPIHANCRHYKIYTCDRCEQLHSLPDNDGRTSLHNTARVNNYDAARMLLEHGADANAVAGCDGSLPIHDAILANTRRYHSLYHIPLDKGPDRASQGPHLRPPQYAPSCPALPGPAFPSTLRPRVVLQWKQIR